MTVDKTEGRDTDQSTPVEIMRHRIKQECRLLHLTANHLENPQEWKESVRDVESQSTSQARNAQPRMPSARIATKLGHFYKVCQSKKKAIRANLAQVTPQTEQDTHINENGVRQPNPPVVNMLKIGNFIHRMCMIMFYL